MTTDLRADEARIRVPVLLLAAARDAKTPDARSSVASAYEAQVAQIADHQVVLAENARHFIMLDDPEFLYATLDQCLLSRVDRAELCSDLAVPRLGARGDR